jgi:hypothetical protein
MKPYVLITGILFGLLTVAHIWRAMVEGAHVWTSPWFIATTVISFGLCLWAGRLLLRQDTTARSG